MALDTKGAGGFVRVGTAVGRWVDETVGVSLAAGERGFAVLPPPPLLKDMYTHKPIPIPMPTNRNEISPSRFQRFLPCAVEASEISTADGRLGA